MILNEFDYIALPEITGCMEEDICRLLTANGKAATWRHVSEVAKVAVFLAQQFGLDAEACRIAGLLHDVSAVIRPSDMLEYAVRHGMELCEAERRYPFLLHQRMSCIVAKEYFCLSDSQLLDAIGCHTTLRAQASPEDMALFVADKLAWDQEGEPPYLAAVNRALSKSLDAGCAAYMVYMNEGGRLLCPHDRWIQACTWLSLL